VNEVFEAGWPGETAFPDALAGRVYSAISKLRRMELGEVITRTDAAGYRLDPRCCLIEEGPLMLRREPPTVVHAAVGPARMAS
jgi:hypothetical protein